MRDGVRITGYTPPMTGPVRALPWADRALCRHFDPETWFPTGAHLYAETDDGHRVSEAKAVCSRCPVRAECLEHALEHHEHGTWGGTTYEERKAIRRERGAA